MNYRFFTVDEVSKILRIPKSTMYYLARSGQIPALKIGRHWRFKKDKMDKWLDERCKQKHRGK